MNYIVALLLFYIQDEENVFWCLFQFMRKYNMRQVFIGGFPKLFEMNEKMNQRLQQDHPRLIEHLNANSLNIESTFFSHFMAFSINKVPIEISTRLVEIFLLDGESGYINMTMRMVESQKKKIFELRDDALQSYMHSELLVDAVKAAPMTAYAY